MRVRWIGLTAGCIALGGMLASCSSSSTTPARPVPIATSQTSVVTGSAPVTAVLPPIPTGHAANVTIPVEASGIASSLVLTLQPNLPDGVPSPASTIRRPAGINQPLNSIVFVTITPSVTVNFNSNPAFLFTLPSGTALPAASSAFVALYDPTQPTAGWQTLPVIGKVSGTQIAFSHSGLALTMRAATRYSFVLYSTVPSSSASTSACPSSSASPVPMTVTNNTGLSGGVTVYVAGQGPGGPWCYLQDATSGTTAAVPSPGSTIPGFALPASGTVNLPPLSGTRIYFALGGKTLTITEGQAFPNWPQPWVAGDPNTSVVFDNIEYTYSTGWFQMDQTSSQSFGIPISYGSSAAQLYGALPNAVTKATQDLTTLGSPWSGLIQPVQTAPVAINRLINPASGLTIYPASCASSGTNPFPSDYFDAYVTNVWAAYTLPSPVPSITPSPMPLSYSGQVPAATVGVVQSNVFKVYSSAASISAGSPLASIPKPTTCDVFQNVGALTPNSNPDPMGYWQNVGRILAAGFNRSILPTSTASANPTQPVADLYGSPGAYKLFYDGKGYPSAPPIVAGDAQKPVTNWFAAVMHRYAYAQTRFGPTGAALQGGLAYGFNDDDEGAYDNSFVTTSPSSTNITVILNPF